MANADVWQTIATSKIKPALGSKDITNEKTDFCYLWGFVYPSKKLINTDCVKRMMPPYKEYSFHENRVSIAGPI